MLMFWWAYVYYMYKSIKGNNMTEQKKGAFMGQISKQFMVEEAQKHIDLDMYRAGTYLSRLDSEFKACSIGCSIHSINKKLDERICPSDHNALAEVLNIPIEVIYKQEYIFEGLEGEDQILWTKRFYQAIPEGANLSWTEEYFRVAYIQCSTMKEYADRFIERLEDCETF